MNSSVNFTVTLDVIDLYFGFTIVAFVVYILCITIQHLINENYLADIKARNELHDVKIKLLEIEPKLAFTEKKLVEAEAFAKECSSHSTTMYYENCELKEANRNLKFRKEGLERWGYTNYAKVRDLEIKISRLNYLLQLLEETVLAKRYAYLEKQYDELNTKYEEFKVLHSELKTLKSDNFEHLQKIEHLTRVILRSDYIIQYLYTCEGQKLTREELSEMYRKLKQEQCKFIIPKEFKEKFGRKH